MRQAPTRSRSVKWRCWRRSFPSNILAAAVNYHSHVPSGKSVLKDDEAPSVPQLFFKPSSSVIGPEETIVLPAGARRVDAEGELVAVIGRECRKATPPRRWTTYSDIPAATTLALAHWQRDDVQWWRAKGSDTFTAGLAPRLHRS